MITCDVLYINDTSKTIRNFNFIEVSIKANILAATLNNKPKFYIIQGIEIAMPWYVKYQSKK